jgi:hypothetical protein
MDSSLAYVYYEDEPGANPPPTFFPRTRRPSDMVTAMTSPVIDGVNFNYNYTRNSYLWG